MENLETTFKEFAEKSSALLRFFATRKSNVKHFEDKDRRALTSGFAANMKQLCRKAASECQQLEESLAPTVTAPLVSLPKPSARLPSACAESPPECALVTNGKEAMRPSNTVPISATAAAVEQVIGVSVEPGKKPVGVKLEPGTGEPSMECTSIFVGVFPGR